MARSWTEYFSAGVFPVPLKSPEGQTDGPLGVGVKAQGLLQNIAKTFTSKVESAQADVKLSPEGKADVIRKAAQAAIKELSGIKKYLDRLQHLYTNFDSTNAPAIRPASDPVAAIERMDIRQFIAGLDDKTRAEVFQGAMDNGDDAVLAAFFDKAQLFKLLDPAYLERSRREYIRKKVPQVHHSEQAGACLAFAAEKMVYELAPYTSDTGVSTEGAAILRRLPRPGWEIEDTPDFRMMKSNRGPTILPPIQTARPDNRRERLAAAG